MRHSVKATFLSNLILAILLIGFFTSGSSLLFAQQTITTPDGQTIEIEAGPGGNNAAKLMEMQQAKAAAAAKGKPPKQGPPGKKPGEEDKKGGADKEEDGEKKPLENVKRTAEPPEKPDPRELAIAPDENGLVKFQFRNQPWPDVLRWYADVRNLSFDWQELPGDYINLATQRPHSLEEAGDMINRALLMRGFTMLEDADTLTVVKTEGLNPSLVPRVKPSELSTIPPHRYVRTSFTLDWLLAEEVHQEFASMISKNGKLTPLQSTNRLEAIDAAANLRDINDILEQEQSAIAMENLAREFVLVHARANSVKEQLEAFLGIQSSRGGGGGSMSSSAARMIQQQMQQMQQQMQQAARNSKGAAGASQRKRPDDVYLVANERSNSVIVHAPPNKMAIIASFITRVDVRNGNSTDFQRMSTRMKVFRLASLGPAELVETLNSMDVLEPTTRLQVDVNNNAIIAYASVADQYLINSVIERLDGSERSFQVVQLNRLDAESVAGSIKFLMGAEEEDSNKNSRNRYYGFYDYYGGQQSKKSNDKMRVGANVQDNQLLLWVNQIEMDEVNNLLIKLGELPPEGGSKSKTRIIDASRQPETFEYLQKLKEQWEMVSPNPLIIPDVQEFKPEDEDADDSKTDSEKPAPVPSKEAITLGNHKLTDGYLVATQTSDTSPQIESDSANSSGETPVSANEQIQSSDSAPIRIYLDEGGNLVIRSEDTAALDRLEQIMQSNRPPRRPYDVFKVKYARASWVSLNLEEYFDKKEDDDNPRFFSFFFDEQNEKDEERQLGDRPPLRFIWDNDTNSIVVQGADDLDRKTIKELIELWDVPEPIDEESMRFTELIPIRYSRAENIVSTIKDAYRDLLSANDKTFQEGKEGGEEGESKRSGSGGGRGQSEGGGFNFGGLKGKLSLSPEPLTNSILISAEGKQLLDIVIKMIKELDEAAQDLGAVAVYKVPGGLSGRSLESALRAMLGQQANNQKQAQGNEKKQGNGEQQQRAAQAAEAQAMQEVQIRGMEFRR